MKNEDDDKVVANTKRQRSPNSPNISLDDAISKLKIIYQNDKRAFTTAEAVISHLGYKTANARSGSSGRAVASLKHYGLLNEKSGQFRVSDVGYKILHLPEDSEERKELIKQSALAPTMFKKMFHHYQGELPSDTTLRSYLIIHENFNPESVNTFIRVLRKTLDFANPSHEKEENLEHIEAESSIENDQVEKQDNSSVSMSNQQPSQNLQSQFTINPESEALKFRISRNSEVIVTFSGRVSQEAIEKLKTLLDATKDTYPTQDELEQSKSAMWRNKDFDNPVKIVDELGQDSND